MSDGVTQMYREMKAACRSSGKRFEGFNPMNALSEGVCRMYREMKGRHGRFRHIEGWEDYYNV
jgi:hypothetical protein